MKKNLEDIIAASVCKFNVEIDMDGKLGPRISTECCESPCNYCCEAARYICKQIEESEYVNKQPAEGSC